MLDFSINKIILPDIISDNAVLQADQPVRLWGYTDSMEEIRVTFLDREGHSVRQTVGFANLHTKKFEIEVPGLEAGAMPYTLMIETSGVTREIKNVIFGDIWVMAGQSNMEMRIEEIETSEIRDALLHDEMGAIKTEEIRFFCNTGRADDSIMQGDNLSGKWVIADDESIREFSAVGFQMLKTVYAHKRCPLGGVLIAVGGSSIMSWIKGASYFTSKNLPLSHMNIKGIAWYQGESDNQSTSPANEHYDEILIKLIEDYREAWRQERMPFLIVQLPLSFLYADRPGSAVNGPMLCNYEKIRVHQLSVYDKNKDKEVYLISTLDCGPNGKEKISIHFDDKIKIGTRLGSAALDADTPKKIPAKYTGARVVKVISEQTIMLQFTDVGDKGLSTLDGEKPEHFYVSTASGKTWPVSADIIAPDMIRLHIPAALGDWEEIHYQLEMTDGYPFEQTLATGVKLFARPGLVNSYGVPVMSFVLKRFINS